MWSNNRTHSYIERDAKTYISEDFNTIYTSLNLEVLEIFKHICITPNYDINTSVCVCVC